MKTLVLGGESYRYAERRMGDWKWKLYVGGAWFLPAQHVRHRWPYHHSCMHIGAIEVVLKYAPECRICLNDEHVLYPGKYRQDCYEVVRRKRIIQFYAPINPESASDNTSNGDM